MKVILGSQSPARKELLLQSGIALEVHPTYVDESLEETSPQITVETLSLRKLHYLIDHKSEYLSDIILCADTVVSVGNQILGKPVDRNDARSMICTLNNRINRVWSGISLWDPTAKEIISHAEATDVLFAELTPEEIERYIESLEWQGAAGGYRMQGLGISLIKSINGCHYNVAGLPLLQFFAILRERGLLPYIQRC